MSDKMAEIIKKASELAQHAPEGLREAAFQKAFDALMAAEEDETPSVTRKKKVAKKKARTDREQESAETGPNLDDLDRTAHPEIHHSESGLDNALMLIRAAKDDLGIDGLSGSDIARVLSEAFRIPITQQSVSSALNDASRFVNRRRDGNKVLFRIMAPGEEHLDDPERKSSSSAASATKKPTRKKTKKKTAKKTKKRSSKKRAAKKTSTKKTSKKKTGTRSVGPATVLNQLLESGYMSSPRTIADIVGHAKDVYGRIIKPNEFSPALLRYLRSGKLTRAKNSDEQYEYTAA